MATLEKVRSHYVALGYAGELEKEQAFPVISVTVRGQERRVDVECDRYRHSSGLSEWRWIIRDISPGDGIGPTTREKVRATIAPVVDGWLAGTYGTAESGPDGAYGESRARAYAHAIGREIRDMRTTADYRAKAALTANLGELANGDGARLAEAYQCMTRAIELTS